MRGILGSWKNQTDESAAHGSLSTDSNNGRSNNGGSIGTKGIARSGPKHHAPPGALLSSLLLLPLLSLTLGLSSCKAQDRHSSSSEMRTIDPSEVDSTNGADIDDANLGIDRSRRTAITTAVQKVAPAIVGINVTEVREMVPWYENDPMFQQYRDLFPRQRYRQELHGMGSGFIISEDGYVITNDHVAGTATEVVVTTTDGKQHTAKVIGTDKTADVALLKIEGSGFPYLKVGNSDDVIIGEWVIALGNPFGLFDINSKPTVTVGVVSNAEVNLRPQDERVYVGMIQTDAAISSGNSGGPLVNAVGEVIGMNTIIYSTATSYQGSGSIGIGFAVPINRVMDIVEDLKKDGKIDRNFWTGMNVRAIDDNIARYLKLNSKEGAVIVEMAPNSPAAKAGLQVGDVITEINGQRIRTDEDVYLIIYDARVGDTLSMKVMRANDLINASMTLVKRQ